MSVRFIFRFLRLPYLMKIRCLLSLLVGLLTVSTLTAGPNRTPHVLFIAVDDLRPELGCYGVDRVSSPSINRLAEMGTLYENAYVQVPVCGASRTSLMSGLYPTDQRFTWYGSRFDRATASKHNARISCTGAPNVPDIADWFKQSGYKTFSMGKIYHYADDNAKAWDVIDRVGYFRAYAKPENKELRPPYESADVPDSAYPTGQMTDKIIEQIREAKVADRPFFLTAGFSKPHLPFIAPKKYWDLYDEATIELPHNYTFFPEDAPHAARSTWGELRSYGGVPKQGAVSDAMAQALVHGYLACVSYTDAMIGRLLDELETQSMLDDTIIILWGDHGFQLGDHSLWCKHTLFKTSMHAPLIISAPGYTAGQRVQSLVEMVDIYPTLCELAGLNLPPHLQGKSLVPTMKNPESVHKQAIFGRYHAGETVRTANFQYSEWSHGGSMLFDHGRDPHEDVNVVADPRYQKVVEAMAQLLQTHREKLAFDDGIELDSSSLVENAAPQWNSLNFSQKGTRQPFATVGEAYQSYVNWRVADADDDRLTYSKVSGPEWLEMTNAQYGRLNGTPAASDRGINTFILNVSDGVNPPVEASMSLEVR